MKSDAELLRAFVSEKSQPAFAELVGRHFDFVYSAVLRQVGGDAHLAKDACQRVFDDLARKAPQLRYHAELNGWLYKAAHFAAAKIVRAERRRRKFEEAFTMETDSQTTAAMPDWDHVQELLDAAVLDLGQVDRQVILLRFFRQDSFAAIGTKLAMTEDTARKRVERAVEKLRRLLARRGVVATASGLGVMLTEQTVQAAPAGLAAAIARGVAVPAGGVWGSLSSVFSLGAVGLSKIAIGASFAVATLGAGVIFYVSQVSEAAPSDHAAKLLNQSTDLPATIAEIVPPPLPDLSAQMRPPNSPEEAAFQEIMEIFQRPRKGGAALQIACRDFCAHFPESRHYVAVRRTAVMQWILPSASRPPLADWDPTAAEHDSKLDHEQQADIAMLLANGRALARAVATHAPENFAHVQFDETKQAAVHYPGTTAARSALVRAAFSVPPEEALAGLRATFPGEPALEPAIQLIEKVDHPFPFTFTAHDGQAVDSNQYRGKVLMVDFWITSSGSDYLTQVKELLQSYGSKDLAIVGVNLNRGGGAASSTAPDYGRPAPQYYPGTGTKNPMAEQFQISSGMQWVLYDRKGNLRYLRTDGLQALRARLDELVAEPAP